VENVQKRTHYVTLAVGDGANDVAMIQTASIGVGISGLEGLQAANAADYSIAQFKYLRKLLLVHGTWCYNRICKMIFFIYYKNVANALIQFLFVSTNVWSGFVFFDRWAKMLYNVLLTSLPTLLLGVFEKNSPESVLMKKPYIYLQNNWFNFHTFCGCLFNALFHSILLLWLSLAIFEDNVYWKSGLNDHYGIIGNIVYTGLLVVVCLKSALHTCYWTNVTIFCLVTSLAIWPVVLLILSHTWPYVGIGEDLPRVFEIIVQSPLFWSYLIFIVVAVLVLDLATITMFRILREVSTGGIFGRVNRLSAAT
jgi:phospholipid-transporting ATPase